MSLRLSKYLNDLQNGAHQFERININGKKSTTFWERNQRRIICFIPSILMIFFLKKGFSTDFVAYASTALSILIGLFTTSIIFIFDRYKPIKTDTANSQEKLWDTQAFNYTKQFAYITGYCIVLCVYALILLSFSALFKELFHTNIYNYHLNLQHVNLESICNLLIVGCVIIQRFFVTYWLVGIVYNTLFAISSMVKFMVVNIERND